MLKGTLDDSETQIVAAQLSILKNDMRTLAFRRKDEDTRLRKQ